MNTACNCLSLRQATRQESTTVRRRRSTCAPPSCAERSSGADYRAQSSAEEMVLPATLGHNVRPLSPWPGGWRSGTAGAARSPSPERPREIAEARAPAQRAFEGERADTSAMLRSVLQRVAAAEFPLS